MVAAATTTSGTGSGLFFFFVVFFHDTDVRSRYVLIQEQQHHSGSLDDRLRQAFFIIFLRFDICDVLCRDSVCASASSFGLVVVVAAKPSSRRFFWPFAGFSLHPIRSRSGAVLRALPGFGSGWQPAARVQVLASAASGLLHGGSRMTSSHGKRMVTRACCVLLAGSKCSKDLLCRASRIRYICDH